MDFGSIVKAVAPWIATALTGPLGGLAVGAACDALGVKDKTADALKQALSGVTPEQMLALKQADQTFALQMQELGFKDQESLEAIAAGDRKDARAMQVAKPSPVPATLSIGVTLGYFAILGWMMSGRPDATDSPPLMLMLGSLSTAWGTVMAFWFGTTRDSGRKTELLAQSAPMK